MKKLIIIGIAFLLAAFTAQAGEEVVEIETEEETENRKEYGRTLYKYMTVNDVVYDYVNAFASYELGGDYDCQVKSVDYLEEGDEIQYIFRLYDKNGHPDRVSYTMDVFAVPTKGVQHVVLHSTAL